MYVVLVCVFDTRREICGYAPALSIVGQRHCGSDINAIIGGMYDAAPPCKIGSLKIII